MARHTASFGQAVKPDPRIRLTRILAYMKSFIESLSESSEEALLRHKDHFPSGAELSIQVLKGHLLVEELIRELVDSKLPHSSALKGQNGSRFDCHQMICLAEALTQDHGNRAWIWSGAKRLNKVRNKLAHKLDYAVLGNDIMQFTDFCIAEQPDIRDDMRSMGIDDEHTFECCVMSISTALVAHKGYASNSSFKPKPLRRST